MLYTQVIVMSQQPTNKHGTVPNRTFRASESIFQVNTSGAESLILFLLSWKLCDYSPLCGKNIH